jgi:hypothetical protein
MSGILPERSDVAGGKPDVARLTTIAFLPPHERTRHDVTVPLLFHYMSIDARRIRPLSMSTKPAEDCRLDGSTC